MADKGVAMSTKTKPKTIQNDPLWTHLAQDHALCLVQSELDEIKLIATEPHRKFILQMLREFKSLAWGGRMARIDARYYSERFEKKAKRMGVK